MSAWRTTGAGTEAAVAELREVSTSPVLLGRAAGGYMAGTWRTRC